MDNEALEALVARTARQVVEETGGEAPEHIEADTPLLGRGGVLDSLSGVSLLAELELALEQDFALKLDLINDADVMGNPVTLKTVASLAAFLAAKAAGQAKAP